MGMKSAGEVTVTGPVIVAEPVTVDGTVTADVGAGTQPVSGTVTANAGVNLNTAALALEATAAAMRTALELIDNMIAGSEAQVDVLTLPSIPAGTANIGDVDIATLPTSGGKTITYVPVNQSAAGTTELAAASVGNRHKIVGLVLVISLLGTLKFTDGVGDLTGPMDFAANGGFVLGGNMIPYFQTDATNRVLNLVTTLGAARGVVAVLTEP